MSNEQVPQSFFDRPCQRCNRCEEEGKPTTVRYDKERGLFLCLCYWIYLDERVVMPDIPKVVRPAFGGKTSTKKVS